MSEGQFVRTADLVDIHGETVSSCRLQFVNYGGRHQFQGLVSTLRCLEDNALLRSVVQEPGNGRVLVVDGGGSLNSALIGDVIAGMATDNGWAGVVINGAVRDVVELRQMDFGIKAIGSNPWKSAKSGTGELEVPVLIGGVEIQPGMMLVSDEDGIIVGPGNFLLASEA